MAQLRIIFVLITTCFSLSVYAQLDNPLAPSDIEGIQKLILKDDVENFGKVLKNVNFRIDKANFNVDDGNELIIADIEASRSLGTIKLKQSPILNDNITCLETLKIRYSEFDDYKELYIAHSFQSYDRSKFAILKFRNEYKDWTYIHSVDRRMFSSLQKVGDENGTSIIPKEKIKVGKGDLYSYIYRNKTGFIERQQLFTTDVAYTPQDAYTLDTIFNTSFYYTDRIPRFVTSSTTRSVTIPLIKSGKLFYINVTIGGIKKKYILDTGASDVTLDQESYLKLLSNRTITIKHKLPSQEYSFADGSTKIYKRTFIPVITVGGVSVKNVEAYIVTNNEPLLLGKSFLDNFKSWRIDNSKNVLILETN